MPGIKKPTKRLRRGNPQRRKACTKIIVGTGRRYTGIRPETDFNLNHEYRPATRTRKETFVNVRPTIAYVSRRTFDGKGGPKYSQRTGKKYAYVGTEHNVHRHGETRRKSDFKMVGDFLKEKSNGKFILIRGKVFRVENGRKTSVLTKEEFDEVNAIFNKERFERETPLDRQ